MDSTHFCCRNAVVGRSFVCSPPIGAQCFCPGGRLCSATRYSGGDGKNGCDHRRFVANRCCGLARRHYRVRRPCGAAHSPAARWAGARTSTAALGHLWSKLSDDRGCLRAYDYCALGTARRNRHRISGWPGSSLSLTPEQAGVCSVSNLLAGNEVSFAYKTGAVLKQMTFEIARGEAVALLGPNGVG